jgi:hypothetical protein
MMNALKPNNSQQSSAIHHCKHHNVNTTTLNNLITATKFKSTDPGNSINIKEGTLFKNAVQVLNHNFYIAGLKPDNNDILISSFNNAIYGCLVQLYSLRRLSLSMLLPFLGQVGYGLSEIREVSWELSEDSYTMM